MRPFLAVLPDIEPPERRVSFREKAGYTATALFVFLVCSQLPLYGIKTNSGSDPFYWARVIMASQQASNAEFTHFTCGLQVHQQSPWRQTDVLLAVLMSSKQWLVMSYGSRCLIGPHGNVGHLQLQG